MDSSVRHRAGKSRIEGIGIVGPGDPQPHVAIGQRTSITDDTRGSRGDSRQVERVGQFVTQQFELAGESHLEAGPTIELLDRAAHDRRNPFTLHPLVEQIGRLAEQRDLIAASRPERRRRATSTPLGG